MHHIVHLNQTLTPALRQTLVHELTHNVHSDHDAAFKALNRCGQ